MHQSADVVHPLSAFRCPPLADLCRCGCSCIRLTQDRMQFHRKERIVPELLVSITWTWSAASASYFQQFTIIQSLCRCPCVRTFIYKKQRSKSKTALFTYRLKCLSPQEVLFACAVSFYDLETESPSPPSVDLMEMCMSSGTQKWMQQIVTLIQQSTATSVATVQPSCGNDGVVKTVEIVI